MPLFTYVLTYGGRTAVRQERRSNFQGFAHLLIGDLPEDVLPALKGPLRKEASTKALRAPWAPVPDLKGVWRTSFEVGSSVFEMVAVESKP